MYIHLQKVLLFYLNVVGYKVYPGGGLETRDDSFI